MQNRKLPGSLRFDQDTARLLSQYILILLYKWRQWTFEEPRIDELYICIKHEEDRDMTWEDTNVLGKITDIWSVLSSGRPLITRDMSIEQ